MDLQLQLGLLKFEDVRTAIKKYFEDVKGIQYYEGNNFSILVDALSYLQEMMAYQLSQQANNGYSRTCTDRRNAVENAYKLGYNPHRKIPNRITCNHSDPLTPIAPVTDTICYGQRTGLPYLIRADQNIAVQEETKKIYESGTGLANLKITLPTINISNTEVTVTVDDVPYTKYDIYDQIPDSESLIFFVSESEQEFFTDITFGNGILGKIPAQDAVIEVTYYECFGSEANDEIGLINESTPAFFDSVTFVSANSGKEHEDLESIKVNASKYHSSRGRLITKNDYENYFKNQFDSVDVSENTNGINYYYAGNIYVSLVPSNNITGLASLNAELILTSGFTDLKLLNWEEGSETPISYIGSLTTETPSDTSDLNTKKIIGTSIIYSSPSYIYCDITPKLETSISGYKFSSVDLKQYRNSLMSYCLSDLIGFDKDFRTDYLSKQLFEQTDLIKSAKYNIDYAMIYDSQNIYDTYAMNLPEDFLATNEDYYNLDNNFFGNFYSRSQQPLNRHVLYSICNNITDTVSGLTFQRYLYSGAVSLLNDAFYADALIFNINSNVVENKQSLPVFRDNTSYVLSIDSNLYIQATTTIGGQTSTFQVGSLIYVDDSTYYVKFESGANGNDINWNDYINYSITKQADDSFRVVVKMFGNTKIGDGSSKPSMTLSSLVKLGTIYTENNRINFDETSLGNFEVTNAGDSTLNFSISSTTKFQIVEINNVYSVVSTMFDLTTVRVPVIVNDNELYIAEVGVDGTTIGEFDDQNSKILFYELLGSINNSEITTITKLSDFISTYDILTGGVKYSMSIKPKYKIDNGILYYKYDFDKKPGLYKFININTPRNI